MPRSRARESARRASCQNNLKQMGIVFKMYANEAPGEKFPTCKFVDGDEVGGMGESALGWSSTTQDRVLCGRYELRKRGRS